jgi:hypothetical protein
MLAARYNLRLSCTRRSVAQPGSALALGARCRRFESYHSDHFSSSMFTLMSRRSNSDLHVPGLEQSPHFPSYRLAQNLAHNSLRCD